MAAIANIDSVSLCDALGVGNPRVKVDEKRYVTGEGILSRPHLLVCFRLLLHVEPAIWHTLIPSH